MKKIFSLSAWMLLLSSGIFAQQSYNITFDHLDKSVHASFSVPQGNGPFPTVIINPGSGANDRNGTLPMVGGNVSCLYPDLLNDTLYPYKELSQALVDSGFAVLRYDKLEYTYSSNLGSISFEKLWLPVKSAINYVKSRSDVDSNKIILIGHSEGSSLIPYIAKSRSDIAALISIAGPRTPFDSLLAEQIINISQTCGGDMSQAKAQANQILNYFNSIRSNTWNSNTPSAFGVPASVWYDYIKVIDSVSINYNLNQLPTLFIGLDQDINVPPKELKRFQNEINTSNYFWEIDGLIHYMTSDNTPKISKDLTDTLIFWLKQNVLSTNIQDLNIANFSINISPNPFSDKFSIQIDKEQYNSVEIRILSLNGELILKKKYNRGLKAKYNFNLKNQPNGIYIVNISIDGESLSSKIIKQ